LLVAVMEPWIFSSFSSKLVVQQELVAVVEER
jgi:hypothetical protein